MMTMAITMGLMVGVVKLISLLKPDEIKKGIAGMAVFAAFVWALVSIVRKDNVQDDILKIGGLLMAVSGAMLIMTAVVKIIGGLSAEELIKGGIAIAAFTGIIYLLVEMVKSVDTEFKAGDIGKSLSGFEVLNPELVICHLDSNATMQIELSINKGRGYVPSEENRVFCTDVNTIPVDSIYTPIRNVKYQIEQYRVEQKTDYDKLVLEISTDGSIHPKDALKEAAKILIHHFMLFSDEKITLENTEFDANEEFDEEVLHMRQLLKTKLTDMNLSVRALNCLKAAEVDTLGQLVQFNKTDLLKFRNFGKKSLTELDDLLESLNLSFGTDISKYKLDKE